ncbi:T9SS type A sorting domain-containing protein, partial [Bacteroidota bacterium]
AAGGNYSDHGPMPEYGPNGEVYVVWWGPQGLMMDISTDFGETWLQNDMNILGEHITWLPDIPGIEVAPSFLIIKCDRSNGPNRGTLYINWCDQINGTSDTDVWLIKSTDGGTTWGDRIRVNNDPPSLSKHQFYSWMDIDQTNGHIYIMFYDRRNYSGNQTDVYLAFSSGGSRFSNTKISESPFTPLNSYPFGHYNALSAHNGVVRPVWTRQNNGRLQLMTAIVDVSAVTGVNEIETDNIPLEFGISSVYPNPFNPSAKIIYHINEPGDVKLSLYDALGRKIKNLFSAFLSPGDYEYELVSGDLASGVYYITLETKNDINSKKIMCLK